MLLPAAVTLRKSGLFTSFIYEFTVYPVVVVTLFLNLAFWYDVLSGILHLQVHIDDYVATIKQIPYSFASLVPSDDNSAQSSAPVAPCPCSLQAGHCTACFLVIHDQP
jgi:hypothetical protein